MFFFTPSVSRVTDVTTVAIVKSLLSVKGIENGAVGFADVSYIYISHFIAHFSNLTHQ
jgi:hypothetical protein